jgi:hypothetical protein
MKKVTAAAAKYINACKGITVAVPSSRCWSRQRDAQTGLNQQLEGTYIAQGHRNQQTLDCPYNSLLTSAAIYAATQSLTFEDGTSLPGGSRSGTSPFGPNCLRQCRVPNQHSLIFQKFPFFVLNLPSHRSLSAPAATGSLRSVLSQQRHSMPKR